MVEFETLLIDLFLLLAFCFICRTNIVLVEAICLIIAYFYFIGA
jgi:hypothetical protein